MEIGKWTCSSALRYLSSVTQNTYEWIDLKMASYITQLCNHKQEFKIGHNFLRWPGYSGKIRGWNATFSIKLTKHS